MQVRQVVGWIGGTAFVVDVLAALLVSGSLERLIISISGFCLILSVIFARRTVILKDEKVEDSSKNASHKTGFVAVVGIIAAFSTGYFIYFLKEDVPYRRLLIFLSAVVVLLTFLVLQTNIFGKARPEV